MENTPETTSPSTPAGEPEPAAPIIERATQEGELVGWRVRLPNDTMLVFADQGAMPGFRIGTEFTPNYGKTIEYATPVPAQAVPAPAVCKFGDKTCPCPDGDPCHYEGTAAWPAIILGESATTADLVCERGAAPVAVSEGLSDERAKFEAWAIEQWGRIEGVPHTAWLGWQGRAADRSLRSDGAAPLPRNSIATLARALDQCADHAATDALPGAMREIADKLRALGRGSDGAVQADRFTPEKIAAARKLQEAIHEYADAHALEALATTKASGAVQAEPAPYIDGGMEQMVWRACVHASLPVAARDRVVERFRALYAKASATPGDAG